MEDFINIDDARTISLNDYLSSLEDVPQRADIEEMFDVALKVLGVIKKKR